MSGSFKEAWNYQNFPQIAKEFDAYMNFNVSKKWSVIK